VRIALCSVTENDALAEESLKLVSPTRIALSEQVPVMRVMLTVVPVTEQPVELPALKV
jgi:hypothetical protein